MQECRFCGSQWPTYNALHNHERQCKSNPNTWWTEEYRKKASERTKDALKDASYNKSLVSCLLCKRELGYKQLANHYNSKSCNGEISSKKKSKSKKKSSCIYCNAIPRSSMEYHLSICRKNPDNKNPVVWTDEKRQQHSESMKRAVKENPDSYSKNNVCGRTKIVEYKDGVNLKGSWEISVAEWLDNQGIEWQNEANPQPYFWNGRWHLYFPDFYLPEYECYIEVKGFKTDRDVAKWNHFPNSLLIFEKKVIDRLDYIDIKYALEEFIWD